MIVFSKGQGVLMVDYLKEEEKFWCRNLWEEAFPEDSKEFVNYYFKEKLKDNRILALKEGEKIDAMIHLNPYLLNVRNFQWNVDYLVGVATDKKKRHRGYMRQLLHRMMADMSQEKVPFCFLMPADEAIYRPFGFTFIFRKPIFKPGKKWGLEGQKVVSWTEFIQKEDITSKVAWWMNDWLKSRYEVYGIRDKTYVERLMDEIASEDGCFELLYEGDSLVAMRSFWGREKREERLLYGNSPYVEEEKELGKPSIMARIISAESFVRVIRLRNLKNGVYKKVIPLSLTDPLIPKNQGKWLWHLTGETSWLEKISEDVDRNGEEILALTIEEFTSWLFGYDVPLGAACYKDLVECIDGVFLDEIV